jgi:hypothetical protein
LKCKTCKKICHKSRKLALDCAIRYYNKVRVLLEPYFCYDCNYWHLRHHKNDKKKKYGTTRERKKVPKERLDIAETQQANTQSF